MKMVTVLDLLEYIDQILFEIRVDTLTCYGDCSIR